MKEVIPLIKQDEQLIKMNKHIDDILKNKIYENRKISCCPRCNSKYYIKYGFFKSIQRYKCKNCNKTFSRTTNTLWSYSKKEAIKWIEFNELFIERKSLRFCAKKLNIALVTAFYWRHKLLNALKLYDDKKLLRNKVVIGKRFIKENFKGSRKILTDERKNIWVFGAKDEFNSILVKPVCKSIFIRSDFNIKIGNRVDKNAYITSIGDRYVKAFANIHNKYIQEQHAEIEEKNSYKFFMLKLPDWMKKYRGIATKYLDEYLDLFKLYYDRITIDYIDMIYYLSRQNSFIKNSDIRSRNCSVN